MDPIERLLRTGYPVLRIATLEEDGAAGAVRTIVSALFSGEPAINEWDAARGLVPPRAGIDSLAQALDAAADDPGPALYVLRDAIGPAVSDPAIARRLRRLPRAIGTKPVRVAVLTAPGDLPPELGNEIPSATFALPSHDALVALVAKEAPNAVSETQTEAQIASALRGLTVLQARLVLRRARTDGDLTDLLPRLFAEKAARLHGQTLEFFPPEVSFDAVGGLAALKHWVEQRAPTFNEPGGRPGFRPPRGILLTGISGCGKSYAIKSLSRAFGAALFRFELVRVFAHPQPEAAFNTALATAESLAPCVLWIDEIENAFALGTTDTGSAARISGAFLTWLQEHPPGIFIGATANRIELLPAELLRRGRFDQVFFVDLPDEEERKQVWSIHLRKYGADPAHFDLIVLSRAASGWSSAEIEAAVEAATIESHDQGRAVTRDDLFQAIGRTVPLSVTMEEQIKKIREWAYKRAITASGNPW